MTDMQKYKFNQGMENAIVLILMTSIGAQKTEKYDMHAASNLSRHIFFPKLFTLGLNY